MTMTSFVKKTAWLFTAIAICSAFLIASPVAKAAEEGKDYVKLEKPLANAQNTVIKVFSYDCPFCYKYDKAITQPMVALLPKDTTFTVWHLKTKGKYGVQASQLFAVLIAKDQSNKLSLFDDKAQFKKAKYAYYAAYHDKKERWDGGEADFLKTGMQAAGLTQAEFDQWKEKAEVKAMLATWDGALDIAKIQGIPAFVVNGKYLVYTKSIQSIEGMADLVKELLKK